ncbi:hypothetical protein CPAR01_02564 [Colletotrichum paranaense]|uniref:Uncharacterized protein n=1 Tax=Colletotrichum paranaense TaxID=1914294 RepID=A0ABQ9T192_9PEZI|nr:uncharacterized protein CPAR01_02564 [Colletotrichum paranaense]KAK1545062.1 hypothetical protein CPAR01_02564 [Colletotrichum paranaense]
MSLGSPFYTTCIVFSLCCLCLNPHTYILLRVSCLVSSFLALPSCSFANLRRPSPCPLEFIGLFSPFVSPQVSTLATIVFGIFRLDIPQTLRDIRSFTRSGLPTPIHPIVDYLHQSHL